MMDLIKACETESELDFLQESFVLTNEQKEAVLQQRITIWTNAMADDIEEGNVFDLWPAGRKTYSKELSSATLWLTGQKSNALDSSLTGPMTKVWSILIVNHKKVME